VTAQLEWDQSGVTLDGTRFVVGFGPDVRPDPGALLLRKPRNVVDRYVALIERLRPQRVLELGIYHGGSVAFHASLANAETYVATDLAESASEAFQTWLASRDDVHVHFGVDQGDVPVMRRIVDDEFGAAPLDLVIDDAAHLIEPGRASFDLLFPRLRPGGVYVIEDWSCDHVFERGAAANPAAMARVQRALADQPEYANRVPFSRLVLEVVLSTAYTDHVAEVEVSRGWCAVTRGTAPATGGFDIQGTLLDVGRQLLRPEPPST
jgi:cephalosporin hydroxylase